MIRDKEGVSKRERARYVREKELKRCGSVLLMGGIIITAVTTASWLIGTQTLKVKEFLTAHSLHNVQPVRLHASIARFLASGPCGPL